MSEDIIPSILQNPDELRENLQEMGLFYILFGISLGFSLALGFYIEVQSPGLSNIEFINSMLPYLGGSSVLEGIICLIISLYGSRIAMLVGDKVLRIAAFLLMSYAILDAVSGSLLVFVPPSGEELIAALQNPDITSYIFVLFEIIVFVVWGLSFAKTKHIKLDLGVARTGSFLIALGGLLEFIGFGYFVLTPAFIIAGIGFRKIKKAVEEIPPLF